MLLSPATGWDTSHWGAQEALGSGLELKWQPLPTSAASLPTLLCAPLPHFCLPSVTGPALAPALSPLWPTPSQPISSGGDDSSSGQDWDWGKSKSTNMATTATWVGGDQSHHVGWGTCTPPSELADAHGETPL